MSGGCRQQHRRRPAGRGGARGDRRHPAALRPRRRHRPQGRLLRRPGHPRRPPRRRPPGHPALRDRRRGPFPRRRDAGLRRQLRRRRNAGALRALQPDRQVHRSAAPCRAISAPNGWPPAITSAASTAATAPNCTAPPTPRATRAGSCSPPPARSWSIALFPLGDMPDKAAVRAPGRAPRAGGRRQAGQPGHLLRARRQLCRRRRQAAPGRAGTRRDRRPRPAQVVGRHDGIARYTVGQAKRLGAAAGSRRRQADGGGPRRRHPPRGGRPAATPAAAAVRLREVNWLAEPEPRRVQRQAARPRSPARRGADANAGRRRGAARRAGAGRPRPGLRVLRRRPRARRRLHPRPAVDRKPARGAITPRRTLLRSARMDGGVAQR